MKEILEKIGSTRILFIISVILVIALFKQCGQTEKYKERAKISQMNEYALVDTIRTYKTKNGDLVHEKSVLIASENDLKTLNKELYEEIKDVKGKTKVVFREKLKIQHDTVKVPTTVVKYPDGSVGLKWDYKNYHDSLNYRKLAGESRFKYDGDSLHVGKTSINQDEIGMSLTTGLVYKDKKYQIFVKSDYPGVTFTDIEGSIVDKKMITTNDSRLVFGPSIGYGVVFNGGNVNYGVTVGVNATWNLNRSVKKIFRPGGL